ncbi:Uncharacterised protein [Serratia fonticola]|uniref:hypothetical protein n=1 Tax=Serratia fonticola TaxID=47917 RepID=UPI002182660D|nr:hypothetical protein [Serratia fonticola]CAI2041471.1 Uncharacterised protein [Serratia fonticola]
MKARIQSRLKRSRRYVFTCDGLENLNSSFLITPIAHASIDVSIDLIMSKQGQFSLLVLRCFTDVQEGYSVDD